MVSGVPLALSVKSFKLWFSCDLVNCLLYVYNHHGRRPHLAYQALYRCFVNLLSKRGESKLCFCFDFWSLDFQDLYHWLIYLCTYSKLRLLPPMHSMLRFCEHSWDTTTCEINTYVSLTWKLSKKESIFGFEKSIMAAFGFVKWSNCLQ